ncbi:energy transducer TonB [Rhodoferax sp.]|uniref:energy transducer TonB n=1 Tax=Rhodoferax sp. TaxID=50421 RepID=UPI002776A0B4|nr:energy transducer TonB [Rhodoferax sp.]
MSTLANASIGINYRYQPKDPSRRLKGLVVVIALHAFLGYALVSGLARKGLDIIKKPLEAVVIQEVIIPPPPPPPPPKKIEQPKDMPRVEAPPPPFVPPPDVPSPVSTAPAIVAAVTPPPAPVAIAPPPPPAPPAKVVNKSDIGVACPTQVKPEMPRKATQEGISGVVKAQALIKAGVVKDVTILSGPRVFHAAVRAAMMQYKCISDDSEINATQEFSFTLE